MPSQRSLTVELGNSPRIGSETERHLLFLLAQQTSEAFALFTDTLAPVFLNPEMVRLLGHSADDDAMNQIAVELRSALEEVPVGKILARDGEWSGEIVVSRPRQPDCLLTLKSRVVRLRQDDNTVGYAVMARQLTDRIPAGVESLLTKREAEVANAMLAGGTSKSIARNLGISHRTVEAHRGKVMNKLGAHSLTEFFQQVVV